MLIFQHVYQEQLSLFKCKAASPLMGRTKGNCQTSNIQIWSGVNCHNRYFQMINLACAVSNCNSNYFEAILLFDWIYLIIKVCMCKGNSSSVSHPKMLVSKTFKLLQKLKIVQQLFPQESKCFLLNYRKCTAIETAIQTRSLNYSIIWSLIKKLSARQKQIDENQLFISEGLLHVKGGGGTVYMTLGPSNGILPNSYFRNCPNSVQCFRIFLVTSLFLG